MGYAAKSLLLISDVDDTLLGDQRALWRFAKFASHARPSISIAYASGRFSESIREDINNTPLPEPVAIIGGVGSEIRHYPEHELDQSWVTRMSEDWSAQTVGNVLSGVDELELQPKEFQSPFKVSFYYHSASVGQLRRLSTMVSDAGVDADVIYSSNRDLDFLPQGVNKGTAAAFLAQKLQFSKDHVIVAGNSGNDAALFEQSFYGIIVANAHDDLKQFSEAPRNYLSPQSYAGGVHDGLQHWMRQLINDE